MPSTGAAAAARPRAAPLAAFRRIGTGAPPAGVHARMKLIFVSGLSGAGKTVALKQYEDIGYYCIDNLPLQLVSTFIRRAVKRKDGRYERLAPRVYELTDFLVNVARVETLDSQFHGHVTYHDSCSGLRELGVKTQPRELLGKLEGVQLTEMPACEACCGFGGTFSIKYGDISTAIADEKCANIKASGADAVVLGDVGCMLNIEGRLRRTGDTHTRVLHIAQVLAGDA